MRAGVSDVVMMDAAGDELLEAVLRADRQIEGATPVRDVNTDDLGGQRRPRHDRVLAQGRCRQVGHRDQPRRGPAAKTKGRPVVLVDADLQFGDAAVMLRMQPPHTLADVVEGIDRMDMHQLRSLLAVHVPTGLLVLAAPTEPAFADRVTPNDMSVVINLLRSFAAHIVIDTPSSFNDVVIGLLDRSDDIVMVGGMDIPTIKNVKIGLQTLGMLEIPSNRIQLVLNRANTKVRLEVQEVERTLQMRAAALIPSDILVPTSINRGIPAVIDVPRSGVARSIGQLADSSSPHAAR